MDTTTANARPAETLRKMQAVRDEIADLYRRGDVNISVYSTLTRMTNDAINCHIGYAEYRQLLDSSS